MQDNLCIDWCKDFIKENISSIEIFSLKHWAKVYIIKTSNNTFYLKINHPTLNKEIQITQDLYLKHPENTLKILAANQNLNCFLTKYSGETLNTVLQNKFEPIILYQTIKIFANIQKKHKHNTNLSNINIFESFIKFFETLEIKNIILKNKILNNYKIFESAFTQLKELNCFFEHGDLNFGNILYHQKKPIFIDLAEYSFANPIFSLNSFLLSLEKRFNLNKKHQIYQEVINSYKEEIELDNFDDFYIVSEKIFPIYHIYSLQTIINIAKKTEANPYINRIELFLEKTIINFDL